MTRHWFYDAWFKNYSECDLKHIIADWLLNIWGKMLYLLDNRTDHFNDMSRQFVGDHGSPGIPLVYYLWITS